ncbi:Hypothetical predicted protein, partial [Mytilus galloprovincialis]
KEQESALKTNQSNFRKTESRYAPIEGRKNLGPDAASRCYLEHALRKPMICSIQTGQWAEIARALLMRWEHGTGRDKSDGSFVISGLPSGSYVVEVSHPAFIFDAVRVDITSKGKIRARKVNYLQPNQVKSQTYPLFIQERQKTKYFQDREQWKVIDFLFNPMVKLNVVESNRLLI